MLFSSLVAVSIVSGISILILGFASLLRSDFTFWPPPDKGSWQHRLFLWLFRGLVYPLIVVTGLQLFDSTLAEVSLFQVLGGILLIVGFGGAFACTFQMGWKNAFGERRGLKTKGVFSISRNPVYVATWVGLLGWSMIAGSWTICLILVIWALIYVLAARLEEPWLEQQYGQAYRDYKEQVKRFI